VSFYACVCFCVSKVLSALNAQRLIGCLKLQVIIRKRATNYKAFLWKMTYEDKASYDTCHSMYHVKALEGGLLTISACARIQMLVYFEFVLMNLSFWVWRISGV